MPKFCCTGNAQCILHIFLLVLWTPGLLLATKVRALMISMVPSNGCGPFSGRQVLALAPAPCFRDPLVQLFASVVALAGAVVMLHLTLHRRAWDKSRPCGGAFGSACFVLRFALLAPCL